MAAVVCSTSPKLPGKDVHIARSVRLHSRDCLPYPALGRGPDARWPRCGIVQS